MFRLSEFYQNIMKKPQPTDCGIACEFVDPYIATLNRSLTESVSCFSYTLVLAGNAVVNYNDRIVSIERNDILIYTPGMMIRTLKVSDDYNAICLMGEESVTYEIPYARNVISASYFPSAVNSENKFSLNNSEAGWLEKRMIEIRSYINSGHIYKNECLYSLYSLFILDLLNVEKRFRNENINSGHTIDIFMRFMKLLTENFINHHDILFYADKLAVTTIYLSRIVKHFSGRTVRDHVDRLLVMEASYLLGSTDMSIAEIAEKLKFATSSSFSKFFRRNKSISPIEYRKSGPLKS